MNILLLTDNLMTRAQLESTWRNAGAQMISEQTGERPDLLVVDLTSTDALTRIRALRAQYAGCDLLAFGPHVDGEAFKRARAAGASGRVARGSVVQRVLSRLMG